MAIQLACESSESASRYAELDKLTAGVDAAELLPNIHGIVAIPPLSCLL
jgi:hypothetical protein